jgi:hypothetical protein
MAGDMKLDERRGSQRLEAALRAFARRRDRHAASLAEPLAAMTPEAFRAVVASRLHALERDLAEVRTRINGLLFVVVGAAVTQVVLRVLG